MSKVKLKSNNFVVLPQQITGEAIVEFNSQVTAQLNSGSREVVVDCSGLEKATSSHISILWTAFEECKSRDAELVLCDVTPTLKKTLEILDIASLIKFRGQSTSPKVLSDSRPVVIQEPQEYSDSIILGVQGVQIALKNFILYLHLLKLPKRTLFEIRTIFYEVLINIRDHSGLGETEIVDFTALADKTGMRMVFKDRGKFFDPTEKRPNVNLESAARNRQSRGFGLLMIRKLVSEIKYSRIDEKTNCLEIIKLWSQSDGQQ